MPGHKFEPEEIAVIGGGRGGVETALMLAKQNIQDKNGDIRARYHVTLIEAQDSILNGASMIASRLHLGGEYPLDRQTAQDCLDGAIIFKLLMPGSIYTPTPPMKFLVSEQTQKSGEKPENQNDEKALTLDKYEDSYKEIAHNYGVALTNIKRAMRHPKFSKEAEKMLFGDADKLFQRISDEQKDGYYDYNQGNTKIAGGFQSQEPGINVAKYLAMLQQELELQQQKGNITILTGHKVKKDGVDGKLGEFRIHCEHGGEEKIIPSSQVIISAWRDAPAITPHLGKDEKSRDEKVTVFKRAMLLVDLPRGWKTPPAFIMLGESGGMLSPYNDKTAICYLPTKEAAYRKSHTITDTSPNLPDDWDKLTAEEKEQWTQRYFTLLKERFPVLKKTADSEGATNPRLIIRDTINFQQDIDQRQHESVTELGSKMRLTMEKIPEMEMKQVSGMEQLMLQDETRYRPPGEVEGRNGLFTLYPTKATYSVRAAVQATEMVLERSQYPQRESIIPEENTLGLVLNNMKRYSLANMGEPKTIFLQKFCYQHPDLFGESKKPNFKIFENTWPGQSSMARQICI